MIGVEPMYNELLRYVGLFYYKRKYWINKGQNNYKSVVGMIFGNSASSKRELYPFLVII